MISENCQKIKARSLYDEPLDPGIINKMTKRDDNRFLNVQKWLTEGAAALISAADKLHGAATEMASKSREQQDRRGSDTA